MYLATRAQSRTNTANIALATRGPMPTAIRTDLVSRPTRHLHGLTAPGIAFPEIPEGSIGRAATVPGAPILPLCNRFLVARTVLLKG